MLIAHVMAMACRVGPFRAGVVATLLLVLTAVGRGALRPSPSPHAAPSLQRTEAESIPAEEATGEDTAPTPAQLDAARTLLTEAHLDAGGTVRVYGCVASSGQLEVETERGRKSRLETGDIHSFRWIRREDRPDFLLLVTDGGHGTGYRATAQRLFCFDRSRIDEILCLPESVFECSYPEDELQRITVQDTLIHFGANLALENWPTLRTHTVQSRDDYRDPDGRDERGRHVSRSVTTTEQAEYVFDPKMWKYRIAWRRGRNRQ